MSLPIDFEQKIKQQPSQSGYPYQISAADLMQNFVYAAGEFKEEEFEITESKGESSQHTTRKISLKNSLVGTDQGNIPYWDKNLNEGLGGWRMVLPDAQGQLFYWNKNLGGLGGWQMIAPPTKPGEFLYWDVEANSGAGGWSLHDPAGEGTLVYFSNDSKKWENFIPADPCVIFFKDKEWQSLAIPEDGDDPLQLTATGGALSWAPGIPTPPTSGTHVLGAVDGALAWISTEEC
jgi:hypothetical protein